MRLGTAGIERRAVCVVRDVARHDRHDGRPPLWRILKAQLAPVARALVDKERRRVEERPVLHMHKRRQLPRCGTGREDQGGRVGKRRGARRVGWRVEPVCLLAGNHGQRAAIDRRAAGPVE
eukprot:scaffold18562_cov63-Phaeocystis_antarctica.AAC.6